MLKKTLLLLSTLLLLTLVGTTVQYWDNLTPDQESETQRLLFSDQEFYQPLQSIDEPIHPIPHLKKLSPALQQRVDLGRKLFNDPRLSGSGEISCSTCHNLAIGGHDPRGTSLGITQTPLRRNSPTIFNATFNAMQFWDGRTKDLFEQAAHPILNPQEMGGSGKQSLNASVLTATWSHYSLSILKGSRQPTFKMLSPCLSVP